MTTATRRGAAPAPPARQTMPAAPSRRTRDRDARSKERLHAFLHRRGDPRRAPGPRAEAGERHPRFGQRRAVAQYRLVGDEPRAAELAQRECDVEPVGKLRGPPEVDLDAVDDEHDAVVA